MRLNKKLVIIFTCMIVFTMSFSQSLVMAQENGTIITEIVEQNNIEDKEENQEENANDHPLEEVTQTEEHPVDLQNENSEDNIEETEEVEIDNEAETVEPLEVVHITHAYQLKESTVTITVNNDEEITEPNTFLYQYEINGETTEWTDSKVHQAEELIPNTEYTVKFLVKRDDQIIYQVEESVTTLCDVPAIQLEKNDQEQLILKLNDQNPLHTHYKIMCNEHYINEKGNIVEDVTMISLDNKEMILHNLENKNYAFKAQAINSNDQASSWSEEIISVQKEEVEKTNETKDVIIQTFDFETPSDAYTLNLEEEPKNDQHSIRLRGNEVYTIPVSTEGFHNIEVSFYMSTMGLASDEICYVRYFNGFSWHLVDRIHHGETFKKLTYLLPNWASADCADFKIKFEVSGKPTSSCIIDDVTIRSLAVNPMPSSNQLFTSKATRSDLEDNYNHNIYPENMYDLGEEMPFSIGDTVDEDINPITGNVQLSYDDIVLKGKNGFDFVLTRYYSQSQANIVENLVEDRGGYLAEERNFITFNDRTYNIGAGWAFDLPSLEFHGYPTLHYGRKGTFIVDSYSMAMDRYIFVNYKLYDVVLSVDWDKNMFSNGQDYSAYYLTEPNGDIFYFNDSGRLIGKVDRYGNTIKFYHTQLTNEFNSPYWVLSKVIDSCNREVRFYYQYASDKISIQVYDGQSTNTIQYNLARVINETTERFGNYMPQSEIVLKSVVDMENNTTSYVYRYESVKASMLEKDINNAEKNIYVNLESAYYPTGARNFYWYNKYEKDFGPTGRREYYRIQIERDILKNDCGSGLLFNTKSYGYTINPYIEKVDTRIFYHGNYGEEIFASSYNRINSKTFKGNDHKTVEEYTYDSYNLLKKKKVSTYNTNTSDIMVRHYDYTYDYKGQLLNIWDEQAERDSSHQLVNPDTDKHLVKYTYHPKYNFITLNEYWQDNTTKVKMIKEPTSDNKSVEWVKTYLNDILKEKKQFLYDAYGNIVETRYYLEDNNFSTYTSQKFSYQDNRSRNAFNGAYLTRKWIDNIKDAQGNLIQPLAGNSPGTLDEEYYYDHVGNLVEFKNGEGQSTSYTYDKIHRKTQQTNPDSSTITWQYTLNANENSVLRTDENSNQLKYNYDGIGKLVSVKDMHTLKNLLSMQYDTNYQPTQSTDGEGNRHEMTYYSGGRIKQEKTYDINNTVMDDIQYTYEDAIENGTQSKTKIQTRKGDNYVKETLYEIINRNPSGHMVKKETSFYGTDYMATYKHDFLGNTIEAKDPRAYGESWSDTYTSRYTYDYSGRIVRSYNVENNYTFNHYNAIGQLTESRDILGNKDTSPYGTLYKYDTAGRLIEQKIPFEKIGTTLYYQVIRNYYDKNNNIIKKEISKNKASESTTYTKQTYAYDNRNNLTQVTLYNNGQEENLTQYYYDKAGNLLRMYTGLSKPLTINGLDDVVPTGDDTYAVTKYTYDHMNRISKQTDPLNQIESYTYNSNNQLIHKVDRNNNIHNYTYKGTDILTQQIRNSQGTQEVKKTYDWTVGHHPLSITDESGSQITFLYDPLGRLLKETEGNVTKEYTYDANDNLITELIKDASTILRSTTYTYDKLNRLIEIHENGTQEATYTYDANGNRKVQTYKNGNSTEYAYNLANRITELNNKQGTTELLKFQYDYLLNGNQLSEKQPIIQKERTFIYDDLGRLQTESKVLNSTLQQTYQYGYDDANNRQSLTATGQENYTKVYNYDINNRLIKDIKSIAATPALTNNYTYDPNGNTLTQTTIIPNQADSNQTRTYNLYNQLQTVNTSTDVINYTYSINGLRNAKTVNGITTDLINSGNHVIAEHTNGQYTTYLRGINLISNNTSKDYYLYNAHGDVVALADETGQIKKQYHYDAFGVEHSPEQSDTNPFRYCGEYYDQETGDIYLRARYYSPVIGRFDSEDSYRGNISDPLSLNLYTYAHNNPVMYIDPSGHSKQNVFLGNGLSWPSPSSGRGAYTITLSNPRIVQPAVQTSFIGNNPALLTPTYTSSMMNNLAMASGYEFEIEDPAMAEIYAKKNMASEGKLGKQANSSSASSGMPDPEDPNKKDKDKKGDISSASPYELEPTHSQTLSNRQLNKLVKDIKENGIQKTIKYVKVDGTKYVVDGHHRLIAAKKLRLKVIPIEQVQLPYSGYKTVEDLYWFD